MISNTSIGTDLNRKHLNKVNDLFTENLKIAFYNLYFKHFSHSFKHEQQRIIILIIVYIRDCAKCFKHF